MLLNPINAFLSNVTILFDSNKSDFRFVSVLNGPSSILVNLLFCKKNVSSLVKPLKSNGSIFVN